MTDETASIPCGCMGKTSLERVVYPARRQVRQRLAANAVYLAGTLDCGLIPRYESVEWETAQVTVDADGSVRRLKTADLSTPTWGLAAVLTASEHARTDEAFADVLRAGYGAAGTDTRLTVAKGHSIQVSNADRTTLSFDLFSPDGALQSGYVAGNVDVIHAFPGLDPTTQATIASAHALNDCYAYGASSARRVRPIVSAPKSAKMPSKEAVRTWYRDGYSDAADLRRPTVLSHGGDGWLFGASVTAELAHTPPIHAGRVKPNDIVVLSRPLGAVAALSAARSENDAKTGRRAVETLATDHTAVAETIASASPNTPAEFDPEYHVKLATDVSGPGIGGVVESIARSGHRLHVERLPFIDDESISRARRRWLVPDATVGTNGPIAMVGTPAAMERIERRLRAAGERPVRLGRVENGDGRAPVSSADAIELSQYIEDPALFELDRRDVKQPTPGRRHTQERQ